MTTRVVSDGNVDAADQLEDEVTRADRRRPLTAGDDMFNTASPRTARRLRCIRCAAADTRDTTGHDSDDGIHRRVAVVDASGHQR